MVAEGASYEMEFLFNQTNMMYPLWIIYPQINPQTGSRRVPIGRVTVHEKRRLVLLCCWLWPAPKTGKIEALVGAGAGPRDTE
jgi:hypothetical protein